MSRAALSQLAARLSAFYAAIFLVAGIQLPFWPVWLAARGLSAREIGIVLAAAIWVRVFATPAIGVITDRLGARRAVMGVLAATALVSYASLWSVGDFGVLVSLTPRRTDGAIGADAARRHRYPRYFPLGRARLWAHPRLGLGELYPRFARQRCRPLVGFGRASPPSGARCLRTCTARMPRRSVAAASAQPIYASVSSRPRGGLVMLAAGELYARCAGWAYLFMAVLSAPGLFGAAGLCLPLPP